MTEKTIVAATGNAHKLREFREILTGFTILSQREAGFCGEVEETGETFAENALLKARAVSAATGLPALADDSGLCVDALGGAPGVYSARYSARRGFCGTDPKKTDENNRLCLLRDLSGAADRRAHFCCAVALVFPDGREFTAEGSAQGTILQEERGEGGFGYDSLFWSEELGMTFASANEVQKNAVSHRGRALRALAERLKGV